MSRRAGPVERRRERRAAQAAGHALVELSREQQAEQRGSLREQLIAQGLIVPVPFAGTPPGAVEDASPVPTAPAPPSESGA